MAKVVVDVGPAAAQALTVGIAAVNNIGPTVIDRGGPVRLEGVLTVNNPAASTPTVTAALRKNGVQIASTVRTIVMVASSRVQMLLDHIDPAAAVGDIFTMEVNTSAAVAAHELTANQSSLVCEGLSSDGALCAGIGPAVA